MTNRERILNILDGELPDRMRLDAGDDRTHRGEPGHLGSLSVGYRSPFGLRIVGNGFPKRNDARRNSSIPSGSGAIAAMVRAGGPPRNTLSGKASPRATACEK